MDEAAVRRLLDDVRSGGPAPGCAVAELGRLPFADLGFARVDHHRALRQGRAETVYGPGKTPEQCAAIASELLREGDSPVLLTRATPDQIDATLATNPDATVRGTTVIWRPAAPRPEPLAVPLAGHAHPPA